MLTKHKQQKRWNPKWVGTFYFCGEAKSTNNCHTFCDVSYLENLIFFLTLTRNPDTISFNTLARFEFSFSWGLVFRGSILYLLKTCKPCFIYNITFDDILRSSKWKLGWNQFSFYFNTWLTLSWACILFFYNKGH